MLNFIFNGPCEAQKTKINTLTNVGIYQGPDEATRAKINQFIKVFLENKRLSQALSQMTRMKDKIAYLKGYMPNDLDLNDAQLEKLIIANTTVIADIEALLVQQHHKKLNPALKLAFQTSLCLAATYLTPELFALYTSTQALAAIVKPHLGLYEELSDYIATHGLKIALTTLCSISGNTFSNQLSRLIMPSFMTQLPLYYRIPLIVVILSSVSKPAKFILNNALEPIKQLGETVVQPEVKENARDFFDIMYGQADEATLKKHEESLACRSLGEVGEDCARGLGFLWNSLPSLFPRRKQVEAPQNVSQTNRMVN